MKPLQIRNLILLISIVLLGLLSWKVYSLRKFKDRTTELNGVNKKLQNELDLLKAERTLYWDTIDSLDMEYFHLDKEFQKVNKELEILRDSLARTPEIIDSLPTGQSYDYLQARYSDSSEKEYPFSEGQVKDIHKDIAIGDIYEGLYLKLTDSEAILQNKLDNKEKVESGLLSVIDSYKEETEALKKANQKILEKNIKVKTQRNVVILVSVIEAVGIGFLIAL